MFTLKPAQDILFSYKFFLFDNDRFTMYLFPCSHISNELTLRKLIAHYFDLLKLTLVFLV